MKSTYISIYMLLSLGAAAQDWSQHGNSGKTPEKGTITGSIRDHTTGQPMEYATVALYSAKDSSLVTGSITDHKGVYKLQAAYADYFLKVEFISYKPLVIGDLMLNAKKHYMKLKTISMVASAKELESVDITAEKGQMQMGLDKKVFNMEKDLNAMGGTAQDALENIPSVQVDMDGSISLRGSSNVRILIDGKPSALTGISSAEALEQIPANTIESIEIITNPSVKYDAEGMAGIINIVLKKNKKSGLNGLLSLTAALPQRHTASLNMNYGMGKINLFGSYSASYSEGPGESLAYRETTVNDTTTYLDQDGQFTRRRLTHIGKFGFDLMPDDRNTITASVTLRNTDGWRERTTEYMYSDFNKSLTSVNNRTSLQLSDDLSMEYALDYRLLFNKKGQNLTAAAQYSNAFEEDDESIDDLFMNAELEALGDPLLQRSYSKQTQNSWLFQIDYTHPIGKGKLEAGAKSTTKYIDKDYDLEQFNDSTADWDNLVGLSNRFIYDEQVHAAYAMLSGSTKKKFSYQFGLRAEQTYLTSTLVETNEVFEKEYFNFFPSVHLTQEIKGNNKIQLSYSRRIRRPSFWNLNPFWSFSDPLNWWVGNPDLNPELTHSFEIGEVKYWDKSNLGASIYYRYTDDVIQRIKTLDSNGVSTTKPQNLSTMQSFGVELTYSTSLFKWWKLNGSFNYFRNIVDGGNIGEEFATDFYSWTGRINNNFTLLKNYRLQVMFNYRAPRESTQGRRREIYFLDAGIKKDIWKKKGSIGFRVSDITNTRKYVSDTYGDNFYIHSTYRHGFRTFYATFTYKINQYRPKREKWEYNYEMEAPF